jgi:hypothetical protein
MSPTPLSTQHLLELPLIRERAQKVIDAEPQYWTLHDEHLPEVAEYILKLIERDYGTDYASIR